MNPVRRRRLGSSVELESGECARATTESSTRSITASFLCSCSEWHIVARSTTADFHDIGGMSDRPPASASSWGLNDEWLNDAAKAYVPVFKEPEWRLVKTVESLSIHLADARSMLAMKIRASRGRRDEADLRVLMLKCGITSEEEAVALFDAKPAGTALFLSGESLRHLHLLQSATTDVVYSPKRCDDRLNPPFDGGGPLPVRMVG